MRASGSEIIVQSSYLAQSEQPARVDPQELPRQALHETAIHDRTGAPLSKHRTSGRHVPAAPNRESDLSPTSGILTGAASLAYERETPSELLHDANALAGAAVTPVNAAFEMDADGNRGYIRPRKSGSHQGIVNAGHSISQGKTIREQASIGARELVAGTGGEDEPDRNAAMCKGRAAHWFAALWLYMVQTNTVSRPATEFLPICSRLFRIVRPSSMQSPRPKELILRQLRIKP